MRQFGQRGSLTLQLLTCGLLVWNACSSEGGAEDPVIDAGADQGAGLPDVSGLDTTPVAVPDVAPDGAPDSALIELPLDCPGGAGCPCKSKDECDTGSCLDTPAGQVCAQPCVSSCPPGSVCAAIPGVDITTVCVPRWGFICEPCTSSDACAKAVGPHGSACIDHGAENGAFCGSSCTVDADCPPDYGCVSSQTIEGTEKLACMRKADAGPCPCSPRARAQQAFTACEAKSELGTCPGTRQCSAEGLSPCLAPKAAKEVCDGVDNDCNGQTDDGLCDDANPCTDDACAPDSGGCVHQANTAACDDDNLCTESDLCAGEKCQGTLKDCDDGNPCTDDACAIATGCSWTPTKKACDDNNKCTNNDLCDGAGACVGLAVDASATCNDNQVCTLDYCDAAKGCLHTPKAGTCEDGNPCTNGDACESGACKPGTNVCDCTSDQDCAPKEDGDACNGTLYCDKANAPFVCKVDPKTVVTCADLKETCRTNTCDPKTGKCGPKEEPDGKACNADDSICTPKDACKQGKCAPDTPIDCDDGNVCTDDSCDPTKGCQPFDNIKACDDGNKCTLGDTCASGQCIPGKKLQCDDASPCTFDWCDKTLGKCVHDGKPHEGDPCDADGSVCTVADKCVGGQCSAGSQKNCDDKQPCTSDVCDPKAGCQNINSSDPCDADGDPCTPLDKCQNGVCTKGAPKDCDDKNPCTSDGCDSKTGKCLHAPLDKKACDADGTLCTDKDTCAADKCVAGPALNCDDGNQCTQDTCEALKGCIHDKLDASPCSLQSACVKKELCISGICKGFEVTCDDANPCTTDACDPKTGCVYTPVQDTTDCGGGKHCVSGKCLVPGCGDGWVGKGEVCDDGNGDVCDGCEGCQPMHHLVFADGAWAGYAAVSPDAGGLPGALALEHDLTLEAWIKPAKLGVEATVVSKGLKAAGGAMTWNLSIGGSGELIFRHKSGAGGEIVTSAVAGKPLTVKGGVWTHVAAVIARDTVRLYVGGVAADAAKLGVRREDVGQAGVSVGRRFWDAAEAPFVGAIDGLHIAASALYGAAFKPSRQVVMAPQTAALWRMNEGKGTTTADSGPHSYPLTLHGAVFAKDDCFGAPADGAVCGDGKVSSAFEACDDKNTLACDGCEQCQVRRTWAADGGSAISSPPLSKWAADAVCSSCELTVEAWVRPDKTTGGNFEILGSSCAMLSLMVAPQPGVGTRFGAYRFPLQPAFSTTAVKPGKWVHVAATMGLYAGSELRLYIDGKLESTVALTLAANLPGYAMDKEMLFIGAGTGGAGGGCLAQGETPKATNHFVGQIDEVRVSQGLRYTDDFTPARRHAPDGQTRGLWRFDAASGALTDSGGQQVPTTVVGGSSVADACYGDFAGSATCGDGQAAKWEMCDNGTANGALPNTCSTVCTANKPGKTPDCTRLAWDEGKTQLGKNTLTYAKNWTIEGWTRLGKLPASGWGALVAVDDTSSCKSMPDAQRWFVGVGPAGVDASALGGTSQSASTATKTWKVGIWQHFALQYHGGGHGSLWVDGVLARTFSGVSDGWSTSCPLRLGGSLGGGTHALGAELASLRLSKRARYGQPFAPPTTLSSDASTVWLFDFDDPAGSSVQDLDGVYTIALDGGLTGKGGPGCKP